MRLFKFFTIVIVVISLCLPLVGCVSFFKDISRTEYSFLYEASEIKAIEIVIIGAVKKIEDTSSTPSVIDYKPSFDVVCTVQDIEQFMEDFSEIECLWAPPPRAPSVGDVGIKITYNNEEYEIICSLGQAKYRDGYYYGYSGRHSFDETQFDELIEKYRGIYEQEVESSDTEEITSDTEESVSDTEETVSDTTDTSLS